MRALAWLVNTLTHPQHWGDWWRDWRGIRSFTTRRALDQRLRYQNQRIDAMYRVLREVNRAAGYEGASWPLDEDPEPGAERHLHLVR